MGKLNLDRVDKVNFLMPRPFYLAAGSLGLQERDHRGGEGGDVNNGI